MMVLETIRDLRAALDPLREKGQSVGFTPTMGALHEGHLSLAKTARNENDVSVLSIYVNPTQFGPTEDFHAYPRPFDRDLALAEKADVDMVFAPSTQEMYAPNDTFHVEEPEMAKVLCGAFRPGHFQGVLQIVYKLFQAAQPTRAYFGLKDAQQLRIIEHMCERLALPIDIVACPTLREPSGLAMSSRNAYLSDEERREASVLYEALSSGKNIFDAGERKSSVILAAAHQTLKQSPHFKRQYLELRAWKNLTTLDSVNQKAVLALAGFFGKTRLIDNVILQP